MKKFLLSLAAVACACAVNAQAGAPLYITGDFGDPTWDAAAPTEMTWDGSNYTIEIAEVSSVAISTACGTWDEFNTGRFQLAEAFAMESPATGTLVAGTSNILMPWKGHYNIVVSGDLTTITVSTDTPKPVGFTQAYVRGGMNSWGTEDAWEMTTQDGVVYKYTTSEAVGLIEPDTEFKFADANWGKINFSAECEVLPGEAPYAMAYDSQVNTTIAYDDEPIPVLFVLDINAKTLTVSDAAGIQGVEADANTVAPVYYNLQGVKVNAPANGLYIMVRGNNVAKVLVK